MAIEDNKVNIVTEKTDIKFFGRVEMREEIFSSIRHNTYHPLALNPAITARRLNSSGFRDVTFSTPLVLF